MTKSQKELQEISDALEVAGIDLSKPKQIITEISGFVPIFDAVVERYRDHTRAAVHGIVWRFCQMEDGVCKAALSKLGAYIGVDKATVQRHMEVLVEDGYFVDLTPDLKNRPHVYAETGKVVMSGSLKAHVAQRNANVAQNNAGVAQSRLNKDSNKDSNKHGAGAIEGAGIDWKIAHGEQVTEEDLKAQALKERIDAANIIATGTGINTQAVYHIALAFMNARDITFTPSKYKGQRKAAVSLIEQGVNADHVIQAVYKLVEAGMTVTDLFSVEKTAVDFANQPAQAKPKIIRASDAPERQEPPAWVLEHAKKVAERQAQDEK